MHTVPGFHDLLGQFIDVMVFSRADPRFLGALRKTVLTGGVGGCRGGVV